MIKKVIPKWMFNRLKEKFDISSLEDVHKLTDEQLLSVPMFGKMRLQRLRGVTSFDKKVPTRAICAACSNHIKIEFHVKDEIWYESVPKHLNNSRICLNCFIRWADEKFLPWDKSISLMPVSFHTQRDIQLRVKRGDYTGELHPWHGPTAELIAALKSCLPHMHAYCGPSNEPVINSESEQAYYNAKELLDKYC